MQQIGGVFTNTHRQTLALRVLLRMCEIPNKAIIYQHGVLICKNLQTEI